MKEEQTTHETGVTFTASEKEHCQIEYNVTADPKLVKQAKQEAIKKLAKEVSLPGFRKGKAPTNLIAKKFPSQLEEQWKKSLADIAFRLCQGQEGAKMLAHDTQISFDLDEIKEDSPAKLRFTFETTPTVPTIDASKIELVQEPQVTVGKKEVDQTIADLKQYFVSYNDIKDRGVEEGDTVSVDVDVIENDPPERALSAARFEVKKEKMAKWMFELLVGMKTGEEKEGVSVVDEEASDSEKEEMPPKKVRVKLLSVQAKIEPEVNDEFATKLGCKTVSEMETNLKNLLQKQADERAQEAYRKQINEYIFEHVKFDLPKSMVTREVQFRVKQLMDDPHQKKRLSTMSADERKKTLGEVEEQGEKAIRLFFASQKVILDQKIQVSPEELKAQPSNALEALFMPAPYQGSTKQEESVAMSKLLLKKAEDYLIANAKFIEKKASKPAANEKKEAKPAAAKKKKAAPKKKTAGAKAKKDD